MTSTSIPRHEGTHASAVVIDVETRENLLFSFTCETSWRGRRVFTVSVTDTRNGFSSVTETTSYRKATKAYKQYKTTWT